MIAPRRSTILPTRGAVDLIEAKFVKSGLNARTERRAHDVVLLDRRFQKPSGRTKQRVLELLGVSGNFTHHSFDLVMTDEPVETLDVTTLNRHVDQLTVVEVKSTAKPIRNKALNGFFFGSSETQYVLSEALGDRVRWAFVVLNELNDYGKPFFTLLTFDEVRQRTRTKRVQFQVNFRSDMVDKPSEAAGPFPHPDFV